MRDTERRLADEIAERRHGDNCTASDLANRLMPFIASIEHEAAARALEEAASSPIPREALTNGTRTWLRARAAEYRKAVE